MLRPQNTKLISTRYFFETIFCPNCFELREITVCNEILYLIDSRTDFSHILPNYFVKMDKKNTEKIHDRGEITVFTNQE
jgi:hypothetical protein